MGSNASKPAIAGRADPRDQHRTNDDSYSMSEGHGNSQDTFHTYRTAATAATSATVGSESSGASSSQAIIKRDRRRAEMISQIHRYHVFPYEKDERYRHLEEAGVEYGRLHPEEHGNYHKVGPDSGTVASFYQQYLLMKEAARIFFAKARHANDPADVDEDFYFLYITEMAFIHCQIQWIRDALQERAEDSMADEDDPNYIYPNTDPLNEGVIWTLSHWGPDGSYCTESFPKFVSHTPDDDMTAKSANTILTNAAVVHDVAAEIVAEYNEAEAVAAAAAAEEAEALTAEPPAAIAAGVPVEDEDAFEMQVGYGSPPGSPSSRVSSSAASPKSPQKLVATPSCDANQASTRGSTLAGALYGTDGYDPEMDGEVTAEAAKAIDDAIGEGGIKGLNLLTVQRIIASKVSNADERNNIMMALRCRDADTSDNPGRYDSIPKDLFLPETDEKVAAWHDSVWEEATVIISETDTSNVLVALNGNADDPVLIPFQCVSRNLALVGSDTNAPSNTSFPVNRNGFQAFSDDAETAKKWSQDVVFEINRTLHKKTFVWEVFDAEPALFSESQVQSMIEEGLIDLSGLPEHLKPFVEEDLKSYLRSGVYQKPWDYLGTELRSALAPLLKQIPSLHLATHQFNPAKHAIVEIGRRMMIDAKLKLKTKNENADAKINLQAEGEKGNWPLLLTYPFLLHGLGRQDAGKSMIDTRGRLLSSTTLTEDVYKRWKAEFDAVGIDITSRDSFTDSFYDPKRRLYEALIELGGFLTERQTSCLDHDAEDDVAESLGVTVKELKAALGHSSPRKIENIGLMTWWLGASFNAVQKSIRYSIADMLFEMSKGFPRGGVENRHKAEYSVMERIDIQSEKAASRHTPSDHGSFR